MMLDIKSEGYPRYKENCDGGGNAACSLLSFRATLPKQKRRGSIIPLFVEWDLQFRACLVKA